MWLVFVAHIISLSDEAFPSPSFAHLSMQILLISKAQLKLYCLHEAFWSLSSFSDICWGFCRWRKS